MKGNGSKMVVFVVVSIFLALGCRSASKPSAQPGKPASATKPSSVKLPGSDFATEGTLKDLPKETYAMHWFHPREKIGEGRQGFAFAGVCKAVSKPFGGSSLLTAHTWQDFAVVQPILGNAEKGQVIHLYYIYQIGSEQSIRDGDQVIWIIHRGDNGELIGVKALEDTPANRQLKADRGSL